MPYEKRLPIPSARPICPKRPSTRSACRGIRTVICALDFASWREYGLGRGEKGDPRGGEALQEKLPYVVVSCSGGARMQEGALSLMQMAKSSAALARLEAAGLPFISILADPTTGGTTASFAMLGDLNIAEPNALIGFAGPRSSSRPSAKSCPRGFQRSEFLLKHGMLDDIVPRKQLKPYVARVLRLLLNRPT